MSNIPTAETQAAPQAFDSKTGTWMPGRRARTSAAGEVLVYGRVGTRLSRVAGRALGGTRQCQLAGCVGLRLAVRWPSGRLTWPCTKSLRFDRSIGAWRIQ